MSDILRDIRTALRTLRRAPAFALLTMATIALGIGATTAVFSMVHGVLLQRLPYANGDRLVRIMQPSARGTDEGFSVPEIEDYRAQIPGFAAVAEYHSMAFQLYGRGEPQRVQTGVVSDAFFRMLGVQPLLGRLFRPGEDAVGAPPVVVLSYRYWQERLGGDPTVIGTTFTMNDRIHTVIGVLPPLPTYPDANDIWMPAGACPFRSAPAMMHMRDGRMLEGFALLEPGVTLDGVNGQLALLDARLHAAYPGAIRLTRSWESQRHRCTMSLRGHRGRFSTCCSRQRPSCCSWPVRTSPISCLPDSSAAHRRSRCGWPLALAIASSSGSCSSKVCASHCRARCSASSSLPVALVCFARRPPA